MSVLIKGMEMPETCEECTYQTKGACFASGVNKGTITIRRMGKDRPDWCPLVELPEKHGRLIDADELTTDNIVSKIFCGQVCYSQSDIDNAPTVIEAEGE